MRGQATLIAIVILVGAIILIIMPISVLLNSIEYKIHKKVLLNLEEKISNVTIYNSTTVNITLDHTENVVVISCVNVTDSNITSKIIISKQKSSTLVKCLPNYKYEVNIPNSKGQDIYTRTKYEVLVSPRRHWYLDEVAHRIYVSYPVRVISIFGIPIAYYSSVTYENTTTDVVRYFPLFNDSNPVMIPLREQYLTLGELPFNLSIVIYSTQNRNSTAKTIFFPAQVKVSNSTSILKCVLSELDNTYKLYEPMANLSSFGKGFLFIPLYVTCNISPVIEVERIRVNVTDVASRDYKVRNITLIKYSILKRDLPSIWNNGLWEYPYVYDCQISLSSTDKYTYNILCDLTRGTLAFFVINTTVPLSGVKSNITSLFSGLYTDFIISNIAVVGATWIVRATLNITYSLIYLMKLNVSGTEIYAYYTPLNVSCTYSITSIFGIITIISGDCATSALGIGYLGLPSAAQIEYVSAIAEGILELSSPYIGLYVSLTTSFTNASLIPVR